MTMAHGVCSNVDYSIEPRLRISPYGLQSGSTQVPCYYRCLVTDGAREVLVWRPLVSIIMIIPEPGAIPNESCL